jgi:hypothetical protein
MALGALICAYQEDDAGGLRALFPLAGRSLLEYQVRCASAVGAAPIVVLVERLPVAMGEAIDRLRGEGFPVIAVSDGNEAASRFEAGSLILVIADGLAPDFRLLTRLAEHGEPAVAMVPDDNDHQSFERIDAASRWSGAALVDANLLGSTASMLGDWDLQSTLLRRAIQDGALRIPSGDFGDAALIAQDPTDLITFERGLVVASRGARNDWASRYLLPVVEEFATEKLMESRVRPVALVAVALILILGATFGFSRGWLWQSYLLLILSSPLDIVAARLATLRLRPLPTTQLVRRLLWPASGLALLSLGWWSSGNGGTWGAVLAAVTTIAFAQAARIERVGADLPYEIWLFSRRNAIFSIAPFVIMGWVNILLVFLLIYAGASFFLIQHWRHRIVRD